MNPRRLSAAASASPQLTPDDVGEAARLGFRAIIDNRPDGEEPGQPGAARIRAAAEAHGLAFAHVPVRPGAFDDADVSRMAEAIAALPGPLLAYCRTGTRSASLWALARAPEDGADAVSDAAAEAGYDLSALAPRLRARAARSTGDSATPTRDVVVVGGGSAGLATAASILRRRPDLSVTVVEPSTTHDYQPGWTMVGAGVFTPEATRRATEEVMPHRARWVPAAVAGFRPELNEVELGDGSVLRYRVLVVAAGLRLDWDAIPGLAAALGGNGVTSNYRHDLAPYTRDLVRGLARGRALFTQPPMPIKCAGAPQKAMYLSCDAWARAGRLPAIEVEFHSAAPVLFGVPAYVPALTEYVARYGVDLRLGSRLVAVDGPARVANFEQAGASGEPVQVERSFDMLHAVPPQRAAEVVASSPLADPAGYVEVDHATLRHVRYPNVFGVGDCCSAPNAKTAAAARKQAPVVAVNALATLDGREPEAVYDGYGSCPLTVERGRIVLAEFGYGGRLLPSFPRWLLDGTRPSRLGWALKARALPWIYWNGMLKGREWLARPHDGEGERRPGGMTLDALQYALGVLSGSAVGFTLGLVGGGGSILAVPLMVYLVGVPSAHVAIGTSALAVAANAGTGLVSHARAGTVKWRCGAMYAVAGVLGALVGSTAGKAFDGQRLLALFALVMVAVGIAMLRGRRATGVAGAECNRRNAPQVLGFGLGTGLFSGFFGIGGGFLIVPGLVASTRMPIVNAVGTSLVAVAAFGLTTAVNYAASGLVDWPLAGVFVAGGVIGGLAGTAAARRLSGTGALTTVFAALIFVVAAYMLWRSLFVPGQVR